MPKKQYYIDRTTCRVHNKKTSALAELLKQYNNTLVEFDEDGGITPQAMLNRLKNDLIGINQNYRGNNITVRMVDYSAISFTFIDNPNSSDCVASVTLMPVKAIINNEELL